MTYLTGVLPQQNTKRATNNVPLSLSMNRFPAIDNLSMMQPIQNNLTNQAGRFIQQMGMPMGNNRFNSLSPFTQMANDASGVQSAMAFDTAVGAQQAGPATNGQAFEFTFAAQPGQNLSFASMLTATNDQFIAPASNGIPLFDAQGQPLQGDITPLLAAWDAGTETNEVVGRGANQPAQQSGPNIGPADPNNTVRLSDGTDGLPAANELVNASLRYNNDGTFTVRLENTSGNTGADNPLSPGVFAVHDENSEPLFSNMQPDRMQGLEALAEDGETAALLASLTGQSRLAGGD